MFKTKDPNALLPVELLAEITQRAKKLGLVALLASELKIKRQSVYLWGLDSEKKKAISSRAAKLRLFEIANLSNSKLMPLILFSQNALIELKIEQKGINK